MNGLNRIVSVAILLVTSLWAEAHLAIYPDGTRSAHNDDYTVRIREKGGEWKDLFEWSVQVDMDYVRKASMVHFSMDGNKPVEVMVKKNNGLIQAVDIRPALRNIACSIDRNVATFILDRPQYLSVEFNGDRLQNLHLFADSLEEQSFTGSEQNVIYFAPGVHKPKDLPNNAIRIPDNTTAYLAPGAIVQAKLLVDHAENVHILGRGILMNPVRGIEITYSKNVLIDGITVINPEHYSVFAGESDSIRIRNFKSFSCKGWSDGIDMMSCQNVSIDNVFMRNSDDCMAFYCHRWGYYGDTRNITVENAILWADVAHPVNIGGHGNADSETGDVCENIMVRNIDILEHDEDDLPYQGCMAIDCGDNNVVRNILFEDVRVESIQEGKLFHVVVRFNPKYDRKPGAGIENVTFRNITYNGIGENASIIKGYDAERMVRHVVFDNCVINGKKVRSLKDIPAEEGDFVEAIIIK